MVQCSWCINPCKIARLKLERVCNKSCTSARSKILARCQMPYSLMVHFCRMIFRLSYKYSLSPEILRKTSILCQKAVKSIIYRYPVPVFYFATHTLPSLNHHVNPQVLVSMVDHDRRTVLTITSSQYFGTRVCQAVDPATT